MTLQQILYALTIAEVGSMNKAAEQLYVSQPTLTNAIKTLEDEIGFPVFLRTSRGVALTEEGAEFLRYGRQVYLQYDLLMERYGERGKRKRKFAVSTQHYSFAVKAFVETVREFEGPQYELAIRETRTQDVIRDVGISWSEIGILYLSEFNQKMITKLLRENDLEFHPLRECNAYVFLWKGHPLAKQESITFAELNCYPCLSFEQGENSSFYMAEEILSEMEYPYTIKANDRATMLNLMKGLNGYTLCSGILCQEMNGEEYTAIPFQADEEHPNRVMQLGYIQKKHSILSEIGTVYVEKLKAVLY